MSSIYDKASIETLITRINSLTPNSKPLWGKMSADQMLQHCKLATDVAFGKMDLKINLAMRLLGRLLKKKVFYGGDLRKNSPTAKEFIITEHFNFEEVKNQLIANLNRFANEGPASIQLTNHPFWGKMTSEDWDALMWKHTNHHLEQFGV